MSDFIGRLLGEREEVERRDMPRRDGTSAAALRRPRSHRSQVDLGLVVQLELTAVDGIAQLLDEPQPVAVVVDLVPVVSTSDGPTLARYMARSAQRSRAGAVGGSAGALAMPMLALMRTLTASRSKGSSSFSTMPLGDGDGVRGSCR